MSKTTWIISVLVDGEYQHFEVPEEVYMYIKQLEAYINFPEVSKLKEVYKDRFVQDERNNP